MGGGYAVRPAAFCDPNGHIYLLSPVVHFKKSTIFSIGFQKFSISEILTRLNLFYEVKNKEHQSQCWVAEP